MNSFQESKNELEAAIRYAENAISAAQSTIESMQFRQEMAKKEYEERTGREESLTKQVQELESKVQGQYDDIVRLERDLTVKTSQAEAWKKEVDNLKAELEQTKSLEDQLKGQVLTPTMPVIPRDVAIAIFREGIKQGVEDACYELENASDIEISDRECMGNFEVEYTQYVDLSEHLDLDWIRDKVGSYEAESVTNNLKGLMENLNFECRIHGIDDQQNED
jgi:DNA repair exonuclease SbcCD ATPase subunit